MSEDILCPICAVGHCEPAYTGQAWRSAWRDGKTWEVWQCPECAHRLMNPQPDAATLSSYYDKSYAAYSATHGLSGGMEKTIETARHTGKYRHVDIRPGLRVLDVGCGGGSFLKVAEGMGAVVSGVEPSADGVASCRAHGLDVFHGNLTDFTKTGAGPFDLITANHVMEHHPDPVAFLSEIKSLLAPEGRVWMAVPNAGGFFARQLKDVWHSADLPVHLHHFSADSLRKAFERAGLHVESLCTESENSLVLSLSTLMRRRALIPSRITRALSGRLLSKTGAVGRRIDAAGQGEALLVRATL